MPVLPTPTSEALTAPAATTLLPAMDSVWGSPEDVWLAFRARYYWTDISKRWFASACVILRHIVLTGPYNAVHPRGLTTALDFERAVYLLAWHGLTSEAAQRGECFYPCVFLLEDKEGFGAHYDWGFPDSFPDNLNGTPLIKWSQQSPVLKPIITGQILNHLCDFEGWADNAEEHTFLLQLHWHLDNRVALEKASRKAQRRRQREAQNEAQTEGDSSRKRKVGSGTAPRSKKPKNRNLTKERDESYEDFLRRGTLHQLRKLAIDYPQVFGKQPTSSPRQRLEDSMTSTITLARLERDQPALTYRSPLTNKKPAADVEMLDV